MNYKIAYDGWLKVYKRQIGSKTYDILKDYDAVAALIINEYGEILLVKQFRPSTMAETLEIPAGTMDTDGESSASCLARELKEEAHLDILPEDLQPILTYKPNLGFSNAKMHVFMAQVCKDQVAHKTIEDDDDVFEIVWMGLDELEFHISEGSIQDVKTIVVYWYLKANKII